MLKSITSIGIPSVIHQQLQQLQQLQSQSRPVPEPRQHITVIAKGGDDRYTRSPEAIRRPMYGQLPIIATRGGYAEYQQMGIIERKDGTYYPLFGRRTHHSDKFNYYTRTDTYNPVQLPVNFNKRDCTDDNGCNEVSDGDNIRINGNEEARVKLYTSSIMQ